MLSATACIGKYGLANLRQECFAVTAASYVDSADLSFAGLQCHVAPESLDLNMHRCPDTTELRGLGRHGRWLGRADEVIVYIPDLSDLSSSPFSKSFQTLAWQASPGPTRWGLRVELPCLAVVS